MQGKGPGSCREPARYCLQDISSNEETVYEEISFKRAKELPQLESSILLDPGVFLEYFSSIADLYPYMSLHTS